MRYCHKDIQPTPQKIYKTFTTGSSLKWFISDFLNKKEKKDEKIVIHKDSYFRYPYLRVTRSDYPRVTFLFRLDSIPPETGKNNYYNNYDGYKAAIMRRIDIVLNELEKNHSVPITETEQKKKNEVASAIYVDDRPITISQRKKELGVIVADDIPKACLVRITIGLSAEVGFENILKKYKKDYPDAHYSHKPKISKDLVEVRGVKIESIASDNTNIFETESLYIKISQNTVKFQLKKANLDDIKRNSRLLEAALGVKTPDIAHEQLEAMFYAQMAGVLQPRVGDIFIDVSDKKLDSYFELKTKKIMEERRIRAEKAAEKKKSDMIRKSLDF